MRIMLFLALALLLPEGAMAARWETKVVTVEDRTAPLWNGDVANTVVEINAMLPKHGPRLMYQHMPEIACQDAKARRNTIIVCSGDDIGGNAAGSTDFTLWKTGGIWGVAIRLSNTYRGDAAEAERIVCHEFMHASTGIGDNSVFDPVTGVRTYPYPDSSCVWGELPDPGSFDIAYAEQVYGKRDGHRSGRHHRRH